MPDFIKDSFGEVVTSRVPINLQDIKNIKIEMSYLDENLKIRTPSQRTESNETRGNRWDKQHIISDPSMTAIEKWDLLKAKGLI